MVWQTVRQAETGGMGMTDCERHQGFTIGTTKLFGSWFWIVIYGLQFEMGTDPHMSRMSALFEGRAVGIWRTM